MRRRREILMLPLALVGESLIAGGGHLGRQVPIQVRTVFDRIEEDLVQASPLATRVGDERAWVVTETMIRDEDALEIGRRQGSPLVCTGALAELPAAPGLRTLRLRVLGVEEGECRLDQSWNGTTLRLVRVAAEAVARCLGRDPARVAAAFAPGTRDPEAFERHLLGLDVLLALRTEGLVTPDLERLLDPFEAALLRDPGFEEALAAGIATALTGLARSGRGPALEAALSRLEVWSRRYPDDARVEAARVELLLRADRTDEALAAARRALRERDPAHPELLRRAADLEARRGDLDEARALLARCRAVADDEDLAVRAAALAALDGDLDFARAEIAALVAAAPDRGDLRCRLAMIEARRGDEEAVSRQIAAIFASGRSPGEEDLGRVETLLEEREISAEIADALRRFEPGPGFGVPARLRLARLLRRSGSRLQAALCLRSAVALDREGEHETDVLRERLALEMEGFEERFVALARAIMARREPEPESAAFLDEVLERAPEYWPARLMRGLCLFAREEHERALHDLRRVNESEPANDLAWYTRGLQLMRLGRLDEARSCLRSAVDLEGGEADYVLHLALAELRLGAVEAARDGLERTRRLRPDHPSLPAAEAELHEALDGPEPLPGGGGTS